MTFAILRGLLCAALGSLVLSGCGNDKDATAGSRIAKDALSGIIKARLNGGAPAAAPTITRAALNQYKTPMIMVEIPTATTTVFVVPFGEIGGVQTWASVDDRTVSFRNGLVVATRGFGPDIMQATVPTIAQVAAGQGSYSRSYSYLDGGDQTQRHIYDCTLADLGSDTITVVDAQHTTRHVSETCTGNGAEFTNEYWFENGNFLRKSKQLLVPEWGYMVLQRVIDNA